MIRRMVDVADRGLDRVAPPPAGITVLIYHRVGGGSDSAVDLTPSDFERQLDHLVNNHRVISLDDAVAQLTAAQPTGWAAAHDPTPVTTSAPATATATAAATATATAESAVVVTFDDGTADFTDHAVPLLVEYGVPATLYVATRFVEEGVAFPWGAPPVTWSALADSLDSGVISIGSHSHTHPLFDRIAASAASDELDRSSSMIGERLGDEPRHFAYPKAVAPAPGPEIEVRRRFESAALAQNRTNQCGSTDLHRLTRTPIRRDDDLDAFARKCLGGSRFEGTIRSAVARVRYRRSDT